MRLTYTLAFFIAVAISVANAQGEPANTNIAQRFILNQERFFTYLQFDHIGKGTRFNEEEPAYRIWFLLVNNCRVPIVIRTFGVPDGSLVGEVGLLHNVIANRACRSRAIPDAEVRQVKRGKKFRKKSLSSYHRIVSRGEFFDFRLRGDRAGYSGGRARRDQKSRLRARRTCGWRFALFRFLCRIAPSSYPGVSQILREKYGPCRQRRHKK